VVGEVVGEAVGDVVLCGLGPALDDGLGPELGDGLEPELGDGLEPEVGEGLVGRAVGVLVPPGVAPPGTVGPVPAWLETPLPLDALGALDLELPPVSAWPCFALDDGACGAAHWVSGACGPPVMAMTTATRKAASTAMEPRPANRSTWRRRPDGSAKTGLDCTAEC
jgi:hypothetical protein